MNTNQKLILIKSIHTLIWLFFNVVIFYLLYAAISNQITWWVWAAILFVVLETIALAMNRWSCPLTIVARKYSNSSKDNFDIFLPNWLARNNKLIYTTLFLIALLILGFRVFGCS